MGYDGGGRGSGVGVMMDGGGSSSFPPQVVDEDAMWEMKMRTKEVMEAGPYPERPGELDCPYYIRTGLCRFGMTCKFNHPLNRKLAVATARMEGGYPERRGQPECQYYLKTGTCKFGMTCKFHHPKEKAGIVGRAQLNSLGYPIRPSEVECSYYLRTGQCKFGNTCKFHHPQPSNAMVSFRGSPIYPAVQSPTTSDQQSYSGATNWPISRGSYLPSPRWQGPSSYPQMILPQGLMQVPGWNAYPGQVGSVSSPEYQQQTAGNGQPFGGSRQSESTNTSVHGAFSSQHSGSIPMGGMHSLQNESVFPERPGEPECVFYMKTGDCKYGAVCKYHHPKERFYHVPDCALNSSGLPLRPGEPLCIFYSRYGICKFGPNCKFDHPEGNLMYGITSTDVPVIQLVLDPPTRANDVEELEQENSIQVSTKSNPPRQLTSGGGGGGGGSGDDNIEPTGTRISTSEPVSSFP